MQGYRTGRRSHVDTSALSALQKRSVTGMAADGHDKTLAWSGSHHLFSEAAR